MSGYGQYSSVPAPTRTSHPLYLDKDPSGKRSKHVFGSHDTDVSHVWANPLEADGSGYYQTHARNPQNNLFFKTETDGVRVLYSYRDTYPIASTFELGRRRVYLIRSGKPYSVTTATHMNAARQAVPSGALSFEVPYVIRHRFETLSSLPMHGGSSYRDTYPAEGQPDKATHNANLKDIITRLHEAIANYEGARAPYRIKSYYKEAQGLRETATRYAKVFGLKLAKLPKLPKWDLARYTEATAKQSQRDAIARERRDREAAEHEAKQAESIALWKAGADVSLGWGLRYARLRVIQRDGLYFVETSQRVTVPVSGLAGAAQLLRFLRRCHDSGRTYQRNGHTERIGAFTVDSFTPTDATDPLTGPSGEWILCAGCHRILWTEVLTVADQVLAAEAQEANPSQA